MLLRIVLGAVYTAMAISQLASFSHRLTAADRLAASGLGLDAAPAVLDAARTAVSDGTLGYALLVAEKPSAA
ncbi:hypothetical protein AB0I98_38865 [Streptomyces sp. NPDC050211]|uniref:hypothetical protein n=1 Tax=Streptomyces sp. NPDC050211 TaxID=3154932 RepID=UPI003416CC16